MSRILTLWLALVTLQAAPPAGTTGASQTTARGPEEVARALVVALLARDLDALCQITPAPFSFDGTEARTREEVRRAWNRVLQRHALAGRKLEGIEVIAYEELVKRLGDPPERLRGLSLPGSEVAIANLGGRPTLILMKKRGATYVPFALTD